jgi:hypothetical protein
MFKRPKYDPTDTISPFNLTSYTRREMMKLPDSWLKSPEEMQKIREERKQQPKEQKLTKEQYMALHIEAPKQTSIKGLGVGSFQAVIYGVWYVGIQENEYKGVKKENKTLVVGFETSETIDEEGEYFGKRKVISKRYTISAYEKATLMQHLKILMGSKCPTEKTFGSFDFESLIGTNCILGISLTETGRDKLNTISPLMKGLPLMTPELPTTPPKWVVELAQLGIMREQSMNDKLNVVEDDMPF